MPYKDKKKQYESVLKWREENREHHLNYMKKYRESKKPKIKEYLDKHIEKDPEHYRAKKHLSYIRRTYNITDEQYTAILTEQDNKCAICDKPFRHNRMRHLDHNHVSGKIRGVLCAGCNRSIAALDNELWMTKAQAYLAKNS